MSEDVADSRTKPVSAIQPPWVELARIFAWPVCLLILVLLFWSPLQKLAEAVPSALANSESVTVGSVSLRVGKALSAQAGRRSTRIVEDRRRTAAPRVRPRPVSGPRSLLGAQVG